MIPLILDFVVLPLLGAAFLLAAIRVVRGPYLADRAAALDLLAPVLLGWAAVSAVRSGQSAMLDLALVVGVVGFLSSVGFAWYIEREGAQERRS